MKYKDGKLMRYPINKLESDQFGVEMCDAGKISERVNSAPSSDFPFEDELAGLDPGTFAPCCESSLAYLCLVL